MKRNSRRASPATFGAPDRGAPGAPERKER